MLAVIDSLLFLHSVSLHCKEVLCLIWLWATTFLLSIITLPPGGSTLLQHTVIFCKITQAQHEAIQLDPDLCCCQSWDGDSKKNSNFKYLAKQRIKSHWLCPSLIYSLSHESSFAVSNFTLNITCDPCKKKYFFKSDCVFSHCRPSYVVPTNLFQGIKAINPMFRGYAQQVGHPRWWNECAMFSLLQKTWGHLSHFEPFSRAKQHIWVFHLL